MKTLVFLLEEPSAEEMLKGLLPKILPETIISEFRIFEGKQDLEKRISRILRAWKKPNCVFLVMRDQDSGDCRKIKQKIINLCCEAGQASAVVRIACRELESFYLGDLAAVERGLGVAGLSKRQDKAKYRTPDRLENPSQELEKLTNGLYQKVAGSRSIGPCLDLGNNKSYSFNVLLSGIRKLVETF
jgi:hypothetical protein